MRRCMENPARSATGGVRCFAGRLNTQDNSRNRRALQDSAKIDELLFRLGEALRLGRLDGWELNFAKSVLGQAKARRSRWSPSEKQLAAIRRIIAGLAESSEDLVDDDPLIEEEADDGWWKA